MAKMVRNRRGVRDIQVRYVAEQNAKAQIEAILKVVSALEEKNIELSDDEVAKLANVSAQQVSLVRAAFSKREVSTADSDFLGSMLDDVKREVIQAVKQEVREGLAGISNTTIIQQSPTEAVKEVDARPAMSPSVADVFESATNIKLAEAKPKKGGSVREGLSKLRDLKSKK